MKHLFAPLALVISLSFSAQSFAEEERVQHFKGLPSPDLASAVKNFSEYNDLLTKQLSGEVNPATMAEIHQLTYTLEVALEKINQEVAALADTLEEIHIASETNEPVTMAVKGKEYLQIFAELKKL